MVHVRRGTGMGTAGRSCGPGSRTNARVVPVVATAWNRFKTYDGADPEIAAFVETYRNGGPESLRCTY